MDRKVDLAGTVASSVIGAAASYLIPLAISGALSSADQIQPVPCAVAGFACGGMGYISGFLIGSGARPRLFADHRKRRMINGFSGRKAKAVLNAYEADAYISSDGCLNEVISSIQANEGIFIVEGFGYGGAINAYGGYQLTDDWRSFMRRERNRNAVERAAR